MSPEEIVGGQLDAYNRRDLESFLSFYVANIRVYGFPLGVELVDRSGPAFKERYQRLFDASENLHAVLLGRIVHGNMVIDSERVSGFMGNEVRNTVAIYRVHSEQIESVWFMQ